MREESERGNIRTYIGLELLVSNLKSDFFLLCTDLKKQNFIFLNYLF